LFSEQGGRIRPTRGLGCPLHCHQLLLILAVSAASQGLELRTGAGDWGSSPRLARRPSREHPPVSSHRAPLRHPSSSRCVPAERREAVVPLRLPAVAGDSEPALASEASLRNGAGSAGSAVLPGPAASHRWQPGKGHPGTTPGTGVWLPWRHRHRWVEREMPLGVQPGWKQRSCPRDPGGGDVPWVGLPSVADARQNSRDQSGSGGSTGCLPALLGRFRARRHGEPGAQRFPGHRPGGRAAGATLVPGSAPILGCWAPGGVRAQHRVRVGGVCPRQSQHWAQHPSLGLGAASHLHPAGVAPGSLMPPAPGTRGGSEGPGRGGGAVPVVRRARADGSPALAAFRGLCRRLWGWRGGPLAQPSLPSCAAVSAPRCGCWDSLPAVEHPRVVWRWWGCGFLGSSGAG